MLLQRSRLFDSDVDGVFNRRLYGWHLAGQPLDCAAKNGIELFHHVKLHGFHCAAEFLDVAREIVKANLRHLACRAFAVLEGFSKLRNFLRACFHQYHHARKRFLTKQRNKCILLFRIRKPGHVGFEHTNDGGDGLHLAVAVVERKVQSIHDFQHILCGFRQTGERTSKRRACLRTLYARIG